MAQKKDQIAANGIFKGGNETEYLIDMFPDSPHFLGKKIYYDRSGRRQARKLKDLPDLSEIRESVHKFSERENYDNSRKKIVRYLKKFPQSPDLHALKSIQIYNDMTQGGIMEPKIDVLGGALIRMAKALHNGGLSIFNVNWFINIYLAYLELIRERFVREYNMGVQHRDAEVRLSSEKLYPKIAKVPWLVDIKNNMRALATLNYKLKGSAFISGNITKLELLKACEAFSKNRVDRVISPGKKAGHIVLIVLTLNVFFSKIPILRNLVHDILKAVPDLSRDLVLQKQMILNTGSIFDFKVALASGNLKLATDLADNLFIRSNKIINDHLENAFLIKMFEVDPLLKAIWVAVEAVHLVDNKIAKQRLEKARKLVKILLGERCRFKPVAEPAAQLQKKSNDLLFEIGINEPPTIHTVLS